MPALMDIFCKYRHCCKPFISTCTLFSCGKEFLSVIAVTRNKPFLYVSQFPDCVEFAEDMANRGKIVVVAALDATFQRKVGNRLSKSPQAYVWFKISER